MYKIWKANEIIIQLVFPYFDKKEESRFKKFFGLNKSFKNENTINYISYEIKLNEIIAGIDKRSAIIINKIPTYILRENLTKFLEQIGNINFLYMPPRITTTYKNYTYAIINFINYKSILEVFKFFKIKSSITNSIEIGYSKIQGRDNLVSHYFGKKI